jgi:hypothetical protein
VAPEAQYWYVEVPPSEALVEQVIPSELPPLEVVHSVPVNVIVCVVLRDDSVGSFGRG